jgi:hypothetical protein
MGLEVVERDRGQASFEATKGPGAGSAAPYGEQVVLQRVDGSGTYLVMWP